MRRATILMIMLVTLIPLHFNPARAYEPPANEHFHRVWERTERPVLDAAISRTWMWGPYARTGAMSEPYRESPRGYREVQYFDKTRMEINNPHADPESIWFVTNGLLVREMITGRVQIGHIDYEEAEPANVQVAGDMHPDTPTYATLRHLLNEQAREPGTVIADVLERDGDGYSIAPHDQIAEYGVTAEYYVPESGHTIAEPFWTFMNSSGLIHVNGVNTPGQLFENPFFATGLPITEAYWVNVPVGGEWQDVLLQCFERRCLTYTPGNPDGWQVEAGNTGLHYHRWRYGHPPIALDCIDLNVATWEQLLELRNVGSSRATAILEYRPYETIDDLLAVPGIGPVTLEQIVEQGLVCIEYH
jgi:hypothetical protein